MSSSSISYTLLFNISSSVIVIYFLGFSFSSELVYLSSSSFFWDYYIYYCFVSDTLLSKLFVKLSLSLKSNSLSIIFLASLI